MCFFIDIFIKHDIIMTAKILKESCAPIVFQDIFHDYKMT